MRQILLMFEEDFDYWKSEVEKEIKTLSPDDFEQRPRSYPCIIAYHIQEDEYGWRLYYTIVHSFT